MAILHSAYANINANGFLAISKNPFARRNGSAERPCIFRQVNKFLVLYNVAANSWCEWWLQFSCTSDVLGLPLNLNNQVVTKDRGQI